MAQTPQQELEQLQREVDDLKKELAKSEWGETQLLGTLSSKYECKGLKEAKKLLTTTEAELVQLKKDYATAKEEYLDERRKRSGGAEETDE